MLYVDLIFVYIVGQPVLFINEREEGSPGTHQTYIADRFTSLNYMCIVDIVYDTTTDVAGAGVGSADVAYDGVYTPLDLTPYKIPIHTPKSVTDTTTGTSTTPTMTKEQIQAVADVERNLRLKPTHKLKYSIFKNKGHNSDLPSPAVDGHQDDDTSSIGEGNVYLGNWRRSCSLATYGAMAPYTVIAPLTHAPKGNKNICTDIDTATNTVRDSNSNTDSDSDSLNIQHPSEGPEPVNDSRETIDLTRTLTNQFTSMLNWARDAFSGTTHNSDLLQDDDISRQEGGHIDMDDRKGQNYDLYENSILLCERGGCVFEDKSMNAQRAGAAGLIVGNNEVGILMNLCV